MIYVAMAAFNEAENIGDLMRAIDGVRAQSRLDMEIVIVDDGSTDETSEVVKKTKIGTRVHHVRQANAGFTRALENALKVVLNLSRGEDICVTMDADNTHPAELIPQMVEQIRQGKDLVIASRYQKGGRMVGVPFFRALLSLAAKIVLRALIGLKGVREYTSSFRAYRTSVLRKAFKSYPAPLEGRGFSGVASFLIRLSYLTDKIGEAPLVLRYDFKRSRSRMKLWESLKGYWALIRDYRKGKYKPCP